MILTMLLTSLLIPIVGTVGFSYISERFLRISISSTLIFFIIWLPLYVWVIQFPSFPPKQALDWIWIYILIAGIGINIKGNTNSYLKLIATYQSITFLAVGCVMVWPAISYNASFYSSWLIWLESFIVGLVGVSIIAKLSIAALKPEHDNLLIRGYIHLWLITGSLGLTVILAGSLLIGTLLITLSSVFFTSGLYCKFRPNFNTQGKINGLPLFYGLTILIFLISIIYVEIDFTNILFLLMSFILSTYIIRNKAQNRLLMFFFIGCLCASLGYSAFTEVINVSENSYY